jgi:hypothetical protein
MPSSMTANLLDDGVVNTLGSIGATFPSTPRTARELASRPLLFEKLASKQS